MSFKYDHKRQIEMAEAVAKFVAETNDLTNAEFVTALFTILSTRFDFQHSFDAMAVLVTDYLCYLGIDLEETGKNYAGYIYSI